MRALKRLSFPILICLFFFSFSACSGTTGRKVCFRNICIKAEVADTPHVRSRGLMFRKSLAPGEGMLFVFDKDSRHSMWMKNMRITLDMLWIDRDKKIVEIKRNVPVCVSSCEVLMPEAFARYVLEVNSGFVDKYQIKVGDPLDFNLP